MKKELFIGVFFTLIIAAAIVNIYFLNKLTDHVTQLVDEAGAYAAAEKWDAAGRKAEEASALWEGSDGYTHLVLRHPEIDAATDALYDLLEKIYARESGGAEGAAKAARARLHSISAIEQIKIGSIF
ncbi:DUF4363 family protein [Oscillospiraceae bacterium CM]|nr:DUF4363 family protein [Oscillospiraceae bacterium CM]